MWRPQVRILPSRQKRYQPVSKKPLNHRFKGFFDLFQPNIIQVIKENCATS
jgi:hypothetical protein